MKLTTARLKKLIREEIAKVTEQIDESNPMHKDLFMIIVNVAKGQGIKEQTAGAIAQKAAAELLKSSSTYVINTKKASGSSMPKGEEEDAFMIVANIAMEAGIPEQQAGALAQKAAPEIVKAKAGKTSGFALDTKKR